MGTTSEHFARKIKRQIIPFLRQQFPNRTSFQLMLDGERVLHAAPAQAAFATANIVSKMRNRPSISPDLNPQENVWPWAENRVRLLEARSGTFDSFRGKCLRAVREYPVASAKKFLRGMPGRIEKVLKNGGGAIEH